jgi:hypothetical protein
MTSPRVARAGLYALLIAVALLFLAPLYAMVMASLKPIEELRAGSILAFAEAPTLAAWSKASSAACVGAKLRQTAPLFSQLYAHDCTGGSGIRRRWRIERLCADEMALSRLGTSVRPIVAGLLPCHSR